ncbi:hypothetical protein OAJ26_00185 [bacterium]|nr:hypothetical protein [bacterium]
MSNQHFIQSGTNKSIIPSSYQLKTATIVSNSGKEFNIIDLVDSFTVLESLYQSSITVNLVIADGVSFLEAAKITGSEELILGVTHTSLSDNEKKQFNFSVFIAEIYNHSKPKPGLQVYEIEAFSEHMYISHTKRMVKPFGGTLASSIKELIRDAGVSRTHIIETDSKNTVEGIYPRLHPLEAISWLMRNTFDKGTPYFFFETAKDGVSLRSYASLLNDEVYDTYNHFPYFKSQVGDEEYYEEARKKIRKLSSDLDLSQLATLASGGYSSTLTDIDIATKTVTTSVMKADDNATRLNEHSVYADASTFGSVLLKEATDSHHHYVSSNSKAFGSNNYSNASSPTLLNQQATLQGLDALTQRIQLAGDLNLTVGSIIYLEIPRTQDPSEIKGNIKMDKMLSGRHIVTQIEHSFDEEYQMTVYCNKDSYIMDMNGETE